MGISFFLDNWILSNKLLSVKYINSRSLERQLSRLEQNKRSGAISHENRYILWIYLVMEDPTNKRSSIHHHHSHSYEQEQQRHIQRFYSSFFLSLLHIFWENILFDLKKIYHVIFEENLLANIFEEKLSPNIFCENILSDWR
jgi:hypothetical protein